MVDRYVKTVFDTYIDGFHSILTMISTLKNMTKDYTVFYNNFSYSIILTQNSRISMSLIIKRYPIPLAFIQSIGMRCFAGRGEKVIVLLAFHSFEEKKLKLLSSYVSWKLDRITTDIITKFEIIFWMTVSHLVKKITWKCYHSCNKEIYWNSNCTFFFSFFFSFFF